VVFLLLPQLPLLEAAEEAVDRALMLVVIAVVLAAALAAATTAMVPVTLLGLAVQVLPLRVTTAEELVPVVNAAYLPVAAAVQEATESAELRTPRTLRGAVPVVHQQSPALA
jgi:hypothetical protein